MRILVINTAASEGGALSILREFAENVSINDTSNEWYFLLSDKYIKESGNIKVIVDKSLKGNLQRLGFEYFYGAKYIEKTLYPDVIFSMQNTLIKNLDIPQILYLHQSLPFQKEKKYSIFKAYERNMAIKQHLVGRVIKKSMMWADKIVVQSKWMANSLIENDYPEKKIEVISPSISIPKITTKSKYEMDSFFYPTSDYPYKDIDVIEKSTLLIQKKTNKFNVEITVDRNDKNNIKYIGNISRDDVFDKLAKKILVFPSYIETYGLPLAEARALNSLILAADTEFSREVLDGYNNVYFFPKGDEVKLAELMIKCIEGDIKKNDNPDLLIVTNSDSWSEIRNVIYEIGEY